MVFFTPGRQPEGDAKGGISFSRLAALTAALVFFAEFLIMLLLHSKATHHENNSTHFHLFESFMDASLLFVVAIPLLYLFFYRPVKNLMEEKGKARQELYNLALTLEQKVDKRTAEVSSLLRSSRAILAYSDFTEAARKIFDECKQVTGATGGYVALLSDDGMENEVLFLDAGGRDCTVNPSLPMPIRGARGESYHLKKPVYVNNFMHSQWVKFLPEGHVTIDNVLFAPLVLEGRAVGLLGLANKPEGFNDQDANYAEAFGEMAAIALNNSRTLNRIEEKVKERTQQLEHAMQERKRLALAVEQSPDIIKLMDTQGRVYYVNRAYETLTGFKREDLPGQVPRVLDREKYPDLAEEVWQTISNGHTWSGTYKNYRKDGSVYEEQANISPVFDPDGNLNGYVAVLRDVTYQALFHKSRDYFTYISSHELRTPVTKLELVEEIMKGAVENNEATDSDRLILPILKESTQTLEGILETTSLLSTLNRPRSEVNFHPMKPYLAIASAVEKTRKDGGGEGRKVAVTFHDRNFDKDTDVLGNPELLSKAVSFIISNAIKYTPDGGAVAVYLYRHNGYANLLVHDGGIGIPHDRLAEVLEPYFSLEQVDDHSSGKYAFKGGGMGLGITLARTITEYHHGRFSIYSRGEGRGTSVLVRLPVYHPYKGRWPAQELPPQPVMH